jgi:hypothetical protein
MLFSHVQKAGKMPTSKPRKSTNKTKKTTMTATQETRVLGVSGPDGAGKGYLTENALARHPRITEVGMLTTRPAREGDTKVSVSDADFDSMLSKGELVGAHRNDNGFRYAYRASDLKDRGPTIIEINPTNQAGIVNDLARLGINMAGWIGVIGDSDYVRGNMQRRQPDMGPDELERKMGMGYRIADGLKELEASGHVTIFNVGWDNRETMADDFNAIVEEVLKP